MRRTALTRRARLQSRRPWGSHRTRGRKERKPLRRFLRSRRPWTIIPCAACGAPVRRPHRPQHRRRVFCSRRCAAAYYSGPRHPQHRDGAPAPRTESWASLAERIRARDGYRCRQCGKTQRENGRRLSVDHIVPRRMFTHLGQADNPETLVSLCAACHGRKTARAEQRWLRGDTLELSAYLNTVGISTRLTNP